MKFSIKHILLVGLFFVAQVSVSFAETTSFVHINKSFYCVGEEIQFSLYLPTEFKTHDVSIKVALLDSKGNVKSSFFKKSGKASQVSGTFKIPYSYMPDMYYLQFRSAKKSDKTEIVYAEVAIPIYNFLENIIPANAQKLDAMPASDAFNSNGLTIDVNLPEIIQQGQNVNSSINVKNANGSPVASEISVSIVNEDIAGQSIIGNTSIISGSAIQNAVTDIETEVYALGRIIDKNGSPIESNIVGAYSTLENRFLFTNSNANGEFFLSLFPFEGNKPVQIIGYHEDHEDIIVQKQTSYPIVDPKPFYFNDKVKSYLELTRIRKKLEQHFGLEQVETEEKGNQFNVNTLKSDASYDIREYETFENIASFFKEVLTPLRFRVTDGIYEAFMYNPKEKRTAKKYFSGRPLFIVNGMLTRDGNFIANLPLDQIETVELFFSPSALRTQFNAFGRYGVVKINSSDPNLRVPDAELSDLIIANGLSDYGSANSERAAIPSNVPDLNPQVYWKSNVMTTAQGDYGFSYKQPDDEGSYTVTIVARDEKGNIGTKSLSYSVE